MSSVQVVDADKTAHNSTVNIAGKTSRPVSPKIAPAPTSNSKRASAVSPASAVRASVAKAPEAAPADAVRASVAKPAATGTVRASVAPPRASQATKQVE
ncbi:hypothetical protein BCR33DRAFT_780214 [Rhizoclosmatium globosum]|uniref:Uncharacterized protein n=1 Tax=Rhizoclosmatium globosum TaxID=329046 RepID=A0A1Y2CYI5_9FUNG|nr:hypothetical protein HDU79_003687 [Rhizoclosmatium sp. JEL0117]ORY52080.1 hypothetical protein BCR33DRAFT_780214 [Rhizoclosmatium globosum]|eukprot:ORY52080.1 hypothetical protein BCR33DRAFT_780214 [Rhizoclosmatium globosum]